ncbi:MAG: class I SAM-dependent methyltransferase [Myxococcota bacterium]|nr:class I SAM-dependent methyltransferase [Myxococcota bacterium]
MAARFDARYFRRYYESRRSRVYGAEEIAQLAGGITGLIGWFGAEIQRVLDVGAGTGLWGSWFREHMPEVRYRSIDVSEYACQKYGHELRDIASWRAREKFDLVVCQGVLPYLDDGSCAKAISNIGVMCRGFLFVEAITARDLRDVCDKTRTDTSVRARPGAFYRRLLARDFEAVGCGLFHAKRGDSVFYELERA